MKKAILSVLVFVLILVSGCHNPETKIMESNGKTVLQVGGTSTVITVETVIIDGQEYLLAHSVNKFSLCPKVK